MKTMLLATLIAAAGGLAGCGANHSDIFPNLPEHSYVQTDIGPGPTGPVGPTSGHTTLNPTGAPQRR